MVAIAPPQENGRHATFRPFEDRFFCPEGKRAGVWNAQPVGSLGAMGAEQAALSDLTLDEVSTISTQTVRLHRPERTQVEINDAADAGEFLEDAYGVCLRLSNKSTVHREAPLLTHRRTTVGPLTIDKLSIAGHVEFGPDPLNKVAVIWPDSGRVAATCDGLVSEDGAGDVAVLSQPHLPFHASGDGLRATAVLLDPATVSGVATGLPASQAPLPIRFLSFSPVDAAAAELWKKTVTYIRDGVLADDSTATPLVLGSVSRLLASVTLATFPNSAVADPGPDDQAAHKPVMLRRAMEYMDANVSNDIALTDIAEAVHLTPRAVQYMFRKHLETTPLQYLRRLRLHYAHQELVAGDRLHSTVTEIAARWGFAHTGRFAVLYRQTYGQSPHTTLRG